MAERVLSAESALTHAGTVLWAETRTNLLRWAT
jgi:hypothetical protein